VLVSTLLTLLVVPSLYDSVEINWARLGLKFRARAELVNAFYAFWITFIEFWCTIYMFRFLFRFARWVLNLDSPVEHPVERAARLKGFEIPAGWNPRPQWWQRQRRAGQDPQVRGDAVPTARPNPYAARPTPAD
jgi:hypothetical protein